MDETVETVTTLMGEFHEKSRSDMKYSRFWKKSCQCKKDCQLVYLNMLKSRSPQSRNILAATVSSGWNRGRLATIIDYFILRLWKTTYCCKCLVVVLFDEIKWQKAPRLDTNSMMNSVRRRQQSTNYAASYCKCSKQKQIYNHVIVPLASETNPIPFHFRWFFIRCTSLRRLLRTHWPG